MTSFSGTNLLNILGVFALTINVLVSGQDCKCTPSESCWPPADEWNSLNDTISGRLIRSAPPGSVCYPSQPDFNQEACDVLIKDWSTAKYHSSHPISIHEPVWANTSCNPIYANGTSVAGDPLAVQKGCTIGAYPVYVVNVTEASDVQQALKFAKRWDIRLNIKNTGHNSAGRNTAYGSLSIWTHHLKSFQFHDDFSPRCGNESGSTHMAATIGAGIQDRELFEAMAKHNAMGVSGTNDDVGVVGWATGGGHGFMTGVYGQGADNILEVTMVMPDGEVTTANACLNTDLFWAVRGGGGVTVLGYSIDAKNGSSTTAWWDIIARVHNLFPKFQDQDLHGYYVLDGPPSSTTLTMGITLFAYNQPNGTAERITEPLKILLEGAQDTITYSISSTFLPTFEAFVKSIPLMTAANPVTNLASSRLISREVLTTGNITLIARTLQIIGPMSTIPADGTPNPSLSGTMTISRRTVNNALNPVWRDSAVNLITAQSWNDAVPELEVQQIIGNMTYYKLNALRELDPGSGAYLNEANSFEPGWQWSFFGQNYEKLRQIKSKYDPDGFLWCRQCVGSEDRVQQVDGRLCKAYQPF